MTLSYSDFSKEFILITDSNVAIAGITEGPIGSDWSIRHALQTHNDSEQNYSTIEKELLAIMGHKIFQTFFGRKQQNSD